MEGLLKIQWAIMSEISSIDHHSCNRTHDKSIVSEKPQRGAIEISQ